MQDPYQLLGVDRGSSTEDIKRAYRRLARQLHPDVTGGDPDKQARFLLLTEAYELLLQQTRPAPRRAAPAPEVPMAPRRPGTLRRETRWGVFLQGQLELTPAEAAQGAHKPMTLDLPGGGEHDITLHIPPGTQEGTLLRLPGPRPGDGEIVLTVIIQRPPADP